MEARLKAFLADCKVNKDDIFTHTIKQCDEGDWSPGRYYISEDYLEEFWTLYCNCASHNIPLSILEKPGAYTPLRVDFDFKAPLEVGKKRQYTAHNLKKIVKIYQNEIKSIIPPESFEERYLWCIVLEKPKPRIEDGKIKDGFHLHFPHFICGAWVQDHYLRDRVINKMLEKKVWKHCIFNTKVENIIDERIAGKTWMLYGSMNYKSQESSPYIYNRWNGKKKWGHAFDHECREVDLDDFFEDEMYGRKSSLRYYLPRFLSVRGWLSETPLSSSVKKRSKVEAVRKKRQPNIVHKRSPEKIKEDLRFIKDHDIMDMLSDSRADNYGDWMEVGWTLFNIGEGCDEAFNMWVDFSKRSAEFVEGTCEEYWSTMEMRNKTLGSLLYLAKIDSPNDYREFQQTSINHNLWQCAKCLRPNEYAVAQVVIQMFQNRFKCVDAKRDIWYEYRGHKWVEDDGSLSLKKLLANEVYDTFVSYERDLLEEKRTDKGDTEAAVLQKKIWAYQEKLRTGAFEKQVVEMCKLDWYDKDFYKNINENRSLIGCENGVIDLELGVFREGRPDDYITFSTGLNFNKDYTYDHPDVKDLDKYLLEVFPNKNRREYFLDFLCATLQGNDHKRFLVATGDGDNSKSMMMALLEETFGLGETGYYGKFPPELVVLSKGHSSGQCRPELSRVRGKKIMGIDEITDQQQLNIMEIKRLTGNDSYYARAPFEKGTEIRPQFTLILQCNDPPKVPGNDTQTWNRIRVLDFESKFVIHSMLKKFPVPKARKDQIKMKRFPADPQFKKRLPELAPALLWKIFDRYKDFKERGLIEPKEVLMATDMYKASNDIFMQFVTDRIEKIDDEEEAKTNFVRLQEAYSEFKEWYRENYPSYNSAKDKAGCATLKSELIKRLGVKQHDDDVYGFGKLSRFYGYKMAEKDEVSGFGRSNVGTS